MVFKELEIQGFKSFPDKVKITFDEGVTGVVGPNGSGKTTLLRMIAGLETPDSGEIWFENRCVFSSEKKINIPPEKRGLGFVFQDFALWPHMTVFENVAFGLRAAGKTDKLDEKVKNALHAVQLDDFAQRYPHQLSGGQQQRVAFARALASGPAVILADEPTGALDSHTSREVLGMLQDLHKQGNTVVLITHDNSIAVQAERIIRLEDGRVVYDGDAHAPEAVVQPNFMMAEPKAGEEGTQA